MKLLLATLLLASIVAGDAGNTSSSILAAADGAAGSLQLRDLIAKHRLARRRLDLIIAAGDERSVTAECSDGGSR